MNNFFRDTVEGAGGFVEDEIGRRGDERAGDGEALFLAAGEFDAAFADFGVVFFRKGFDKFSGASGGGGFLNGFKVGVGLSVGDVFGNGFIKKHWFLGDDADEATEIFFAHFFNVKSVDFDLTKINVKHAH